MTSCIGTLTSVGQFVFCCGSCGSEAAELQVFEAGDTIDLGPLTGGERLAQRAPHPTIRLKFLAISTHEAPPTLLQLMSEAQILDAREVRAIDPELVSFLCPDCDLPYCRQCWITTVEYDHGFYEGTRGRCPRGHRHLIDD